MSKLGAALGMDVLLIRNLGRIGHYAEESSSQFCYSAAGNKSSGGSMAAPSAGA